MPTLNFTVDSALLEELGKRLVGKPYIALAELVKNSYDADANKVTIEINPKEDRIVVSDDGHGMNLDEFTDFWMRIGSTHKLRQRTSRNLKRPMTGSKGIGRLAVQYLAKEITLDTVSEKDLNSKLEAYVKWTDAIKARDLTQVTVKYEIISSKEDFNKGTRIVLAGLNHPWNTDFIRGLADEIWFLQPPFRSHLANHEDSKNVFEIEFSSPETEYVEVFNKQLHIIMDIWYAKLVGKNDSDNVSLSLEFNGEEPITYNYLIQNCKLKEADFEIRIYKLHGRQPYGIKVREARDYLNEFGGVHVYDGGFHLPYYGTPKNDWLRIEFDHSHRITKSQLLPQELQVEGGMQFLPTLSRILGVVNVDTSKEEILKILITRDRLQESEAFDNLITIVRTALDFYAIHEKLKSLEEKYQEKEIEKPKAQRVEEALEKHQSEIPKDVYEELYKEIKEVKNEIETEAEKDAKQVAVMGPLATIGISSLAYQHELRQQFSGIEDIMSRLGKIELEMKDEKLRKNLKELIEGLSSWVKRAKMTSDLFTYFYDTENTKIRRRFIAKRVIEEIKEQVRSLAGGTPIDTSRLDSSLLLPKASLIEWSSIFQNVFINAFNAVLESEKKFIKVSSRTEGRTREILVQDTGSGVNLKDSEILFEPFERRIKISQERRSRGYGGMGLGLTIVRMIANNIGCEVSFVEPEKGFSTAFSLKWRESK